MKTALFLTAIFGLSFSPDQGVKVSKIQGIDVYVYSMPSSNYKVIDSGKIRLTLTGGCGEQVEAAIRKAAKVNADAVIVDMAGANALGTAWEAIKYE